MGSEEASEAASIEINVVEILKEVPEAISMVNRIIIMVITRNSMAIATTAASTGIRRENAIAKREIITAEIGEMQDIGEEEIKDIPVGNMGKPIICKLIIIINNYRYSTTKFYLWLRILSIQWNSCNSAWLCTYQERCRTGTAVLLLLYF